MEQNGTFLENIKERQHWSRDRIGVSFVTHKVKGSDGRAIHQSKARNKKKMFSLYCFVLTDGIFTIFHTSSHISLNIGSRTLNLHILEHLFPLAGHKCLSLF